VTETAEVQALQEAVVYWLPRLRSRPEHRLHWVLDRALTRDGNIASGYDHMAWAFSLDYGAIWKAAHDIVCHEDNRKHIHRALTAANVTYIAQILTPHFGFTTGFDIPPTTVTIAVLVLKIGLDEFCRRTASGDQSKGTSKSKPAKKSAGRGSGGGSITKGPFD
jgi:hypothetical protein